MIQRREEVTRGRLGRMHRAEPQDEPRRYAAGRGRYEPAPPWRERAESEPRVRRWREARDVGRTPPPGEWRRDDEERIERRTRPAQPREGRSRRGFASMNPRLQREIAQRGGRAVQESGRAYSLSREEARRGGRARRGAQRDEFGRFRAPGRERRARR
jgi:hypothetical protein